jgi:predicted MPP superfamily phosphohydrolase
MTVGTTRSEVERRVRDRRIAAARKKIEMMLDRVFRPAGWAAAVSYRVGLQGRVRIRETVLRSSCAQRRAVPLRIAFASDFHAGPTTDRRTLVAACRALANMKPDILLLGGDFVSVRGSDVAQLEPLLAEIEAPHGKFAVLGNHDLRANTTPIVDALGRAGVRLIVNARVTLDAPFDNIALCGLDDPSYGEPRPELALDGATGIRVVLMHSPETLSAIGNRAFDLALCGHTHGGQVALPWGTPILLPGGPLNRRYCRGQFDLGGEPARTLLVSRGVGCSALPARVFAAPEVHLCLIT